MDFKFNLGQIVYHKASGDKGVIVHQYTTFSNNAGGRYISNGYYSVSWGPERTEKVNQAMLMLKENLAEE